MLNWTRYLLRGRCSIGKSKVKYLTSQIWRNVSQRADLMYVPIRLISLMPSNVLGQRAKSDNKFFAAMRDKETVEAERKNLVRNVEKQAKLIDKLMDTERNLTNQLVGLPFSRP